MLNVNKCVLAITIPNLHSPRIHIKWEIVDTKCKPITTTQPKRQIAMDPVSHSLYMEKTERTVPCRASSWLIEQSVRIILINNNKNNNNIYNNNEDDNYDEDKNHECCLNS